MSDERPFNYLERIANDIFLEVQNLENADLVLVYPKDEEVLWLGYATLALTDNGGTSWEQVHNIWAMWRTLSMPEHRSIIPFKDLPGATQQLDDVYATAIDNVAERMWRQERESILNSLPESSDPNIPF